MGQTNVKILDSDTAAFLAAAHAADAPPLRSLSVADARRVIHQMAGSPPTHIDGVKSVDQQVAEVPVRIYRPAPPIAPCATVILFHGGGWALGSIETHDAMARAIAAGANACVISVGYRLAPENPFPAGFDDCCAVVRWADAGRAELGGLDAPLVVLGDSAGGNLAAAVSLWARDSGGPSIDLQILLYPVLDADPEGNFASRTAHGDDPRLFSRKDLAWFSEMYLADGRDLVNPYVSPLRAENLGGLPRALIITAGFDLLCDEGRAYHDGLIAADSASAYRCFDSTIHGFISFPDHISAGREGLALLVETIAAAPMVTAGDASNEARSGLI
ncbi:alpha/beta hydrolase [Sphingopyxis panaciterrae]